ncbi:UNVERIFIED_CONTAM: hypothetical protein FKN15_032002 [Acipenser sinensis]
MRGDEDERSTVKMRGDEDERSTVKMRGDEDERSTVKMRGDEDERSTVKMRGDEDERSTVKMRGDEDERSTVKMRGDEDERSTVKMRGDEDERSTVKMRGDEDERSTVKMRGDEDERSTVKMRGDEDERSTVKMRGDEDERSTVKMRGDEDERSTVKMRGDEDERSTVKMRGDEDERSTVKMRGDEDERSTVKMRGDEDERSTVKMRGDEDERSTVKMRGDEDERSTVKMRGDEAVKMRGAQFPRGTSSVNHRAALTDTPAGNSLVRPNRTGIVRTPELSLSTVQLCQPDQPCTACVRARVRLDTRVGPGVRSFLQRPQGQGGDPPCFMHSGERWLGAWSSWDLVYDHFSSGHKVAILHRETWTSTPGTWELTYDCFESDGGHKVAVFLKTIPRRQRLQQSRTYTVEDQRRGTGQDCTPLRSQTETGEAAAEQDLHCGGPEERYGTGLHSPAEPDRDWERGIKNLSSFQVFDPPLVVDHAFAVLYYTLRCFYYGNFCKG